MYWQIQVLVEALCTAAGLRSTAPNAHVICAAVFCHQHGRSVSTLHVHGIKQKSRSGYHEKSILRNTHLCTATWKRTAYSGIICATDHSRKPTHCHLYHHAFQVHLWLTRSNGRSTFPLQRFEFFIDNFSVGNCLKFSSTFLHRRRAMTVTGQVVSSGETAALQQPPRLEFTWRQVILKALVPRNEFLQLCI